MPQQRQGCGKNQPQSPTGQSTDTKSCVFSSKCANELREPDSEQQDQSLRLKQICRTQNKPSRQRVLVFSKTQPSKKSQQSDERFGIIKGRYRQRLLSHECRKNQGRHPEGTRSCRQNEPQCQCRRTNRYDLRQPFATPTRDPIGGQCQKRQSRRIATGTSRLVSLPFVLQFFSPNICSSFLVQCWDEAKDGAKFGLAIDIGHGMVQTDVHLIHTLQDALYCLRSHGNGIRSFSCNRPNGIEFLRLSETSVKQAAAVQPLKPLAVLNVAFASWHHSYFARINKPHLDSASLKNIPYGNPIDTGGLHCHRYYPTF